MLELVQALEVFRLHLVPGDDEDVIGQAALVEVFQHGEGVWPNHRQERVGGPVEHLHRGHVRLEVPMSHQLFDGLGVAHERPRYALIP